MNRNKKLALNTVTSLLYEVTAILCGFILPRLMLEYYGSDVNGLVNSIAQFLGIISFLDLGVGAVLQTSLYKPLADKDNVALSKTVVAGVGFFRRIALILLAYIAVLTGVYPFIKVGQFDFLFTAVLVLSMGVSLFSQYYFGVVERILLLADQRGYVQYVAQIATLILNTVACAILIKIGASVQIVKLTTSCIFLLRPLFLRIYVKRKYLINRKIKYEGDPIKQKWNGLAQHVSSIVLSGTDSIVLTFFSTLANVSIYSVYYMIINGLNTMFSSLMHGVKSLWGELWAKKERDDLRRSFLRVEWLVHSVVAFVFSCTAMLILHFVKVYTDGINDAVYWQPLFAYLITAANAVHCLRLPYITIIFAAGEFKNTQKCFFIAAGMNIVISVICVFFLGLIGVAIGTLVAMVYMTVWMAIFNSKYLVKDSLTTFLKLLLSDALTVAAIVGATFWIKLGKVSYVGWVIMALKVAGVAFAVTLVINLVFYRKNLFALTGSVLRIFKKKLKTDNKQ